MGRFRVAVVVPAFNESKTIGNVVNSITNYAIPIVVNDGSTDNTQKKAISEGAVVVNHQDNMGYDMALNSGFKKPMKLDVK